MLVDVLLVCDFQIPPSSLDFQHYFYSAKDLNGHAMQHVKFLGNFQFTHRFVWPFYTATCCTQFREIDGQSARPVSVLNRADDRNDADFE